MKHLAIFIPILAVILSATGGMMYRHELGILGLGRNHEKLSIKDYRQHRDVLRERVRLAADSANTVESVLDDDPLAFGPGGNLILKQRKEQHNEAKERLENYVEENKHYGSD